MHYSHALLGTGHILVLKAQAAFTRTLATHYIPLPESQ
jgi:hypothetical protein